MKRIILFLGLIGLGVARLGAVTPDHQLATQARTALYNIFEQEENWVKIHAAEALIAGGEAPAMRTRFLAMIPRVDTLPYRVGVWRVLANTSPTPAERAACVDRVEKIFLDLQAPDRSQAIETLCKLRCRLTGPSLALVQKIAAAGPDKLRPMAYWSLRFTDDTAAVKNLCTLLHSSEASQRQIGAYALRLLRETDPVALQTLAQVAAAEPADTVAYAYLHSAAFALNADPAHRADSRAVLENILAHGSTDARFEACHGLLAQVRRTDLPRYIPLLSDAGNDARVGAALTILSVYGRE